MSELSLALLAALAVWRGNMKSNLVFSRAGSVAETSTPTIKVVIPRTAAAAQVSTLLSNARVGLGLDCNTCGIDITSACADGVKSNFMVSRTGSVAQTSTLTGTVVMSRTPSVTRASILLDNVGVGFVCAGNAGGIYILHLRAV